MVSAQGTLSVTDANGPVAGLEILDAKRGGSGALSFAYCGKCEHHERLMRVGRRRSQWTDPLGMKLRKGIERNESIARNKPEPYCLMAMAILLARQRCQHSLKPARLRRLPIIRNCCPGHIHQERPRENCIEERDSAIECIHQPAIGEPGK